MKKLNSALTASDLFSLIGVLKQQMPPIPLAYEKALEYLLFLEFYLHGTKQSSPIPYSLASSCFNSFSPLLSNSYNNLNYKFYYFSS